MDALVQQLVVAGLVAAAVAYIGAHAWRKSQAAKRPKPGCGTDCGCG